MPIATGFLLVGLGGAAGAVARYGLTLLAGRLGAAQPVGTLLSNLAGCLVIGMLVTLLARTPGIGDGALAAQPARLLIGVGFCGAFTTLSSFVFEAAAMVERGNLALASGYFLLTLAGGFACFYGGAVLARAI